MGIKKNPSIGFTSSFILLYFILLSFFPVLLHGTEEKNTRGSLLSRQDGIQKEIDSQFDRVYGDYSYKWLYKANGLYGQASLLEEDVLEYYVKKVDEKSVLYFVDLGSDKGAWGSSLAFEAKNILNKENKEVKIIIITVTGHGETAVTRDVDQFVEHHHITGFKLENIEESFLSLGYDLRGKVQFLTTSWVLRHCVDPLGTVARAYELLAAEGIMVFDGFNVDFDGVEFIPGYYNGIKIQNILRMSNARWLRYTNNARGVFDNFIVLKPDFKPLLSAGVARYSGRILLLNARKADRVASVVVDFKNLNLKWDAIPVYIVKLAGFRGNFGECAVKMQGDEALLEILLERFPLRFWPLGKGKFEPMTWKVWTGDD